jgi:hypothetical protein
MTVSVLLVPLGGEPVVPLFPSDVEALGLPDKRCPPQGAGP